MRTDHLHHGAMYLLCLLTALCLLPACGSGRTGTSGRTPAPAASKTTATAASSPYDGPATAAVHFPTFELDVPADWPVRGNVGKVWEGDGMFLLAGPLDGAAGTPEVEAVLAGELELFFNTEYYRTRVRFEYEKEYEAGNVHRLSGTLHNDRNGESLRFAGFFGTAPGLYGFYFWPDEAGDRDGNRLTEMTYESIRIL